MSDTDVKDIKDVKSGAQAREWIGKRFDEVSSAIGAANENVGKVQTEMAQLKLLVGDANRTPLAQAAAKAGALPITKEAFLEYGMKAAIAAPLPIERKANGELTAGDGPLATLQEKSDELLILTRILGKCRGEALTREEIHGLKFFKSEYAPAYRAVETIAKAAFDIQTTGEGLEYVATDLSGSLIEMVEVKRKFASLIESLPMEHGVLTVPSWLNHATAYGFDENTADTGGTAIDDGLSGNTLTTNFTITAKGIGLALTTSRFMSEDSVIPWLPFLRKVGVRALVNGEEDAMFNGHTAATHPDADIAAITRHVAKRWNGLRYVGMLGNAKKDCNGDPINSDAFFRDYVLDVLGKMDKYGVEPGDIALAVGTPINAQLLAVQSFKDMYINGRASTSVNGIIQSPFGWDYCPTAYLRTNLSNTGYNTSATTTPDKTAFALVHKDSWKKGRVREMSVQVLDQTRALYDQIQIVFTMRQGFIAARKMDGTEPHVGIGFNVKAA